LPIGARPLAPDERLRREHHGRGGVVDAARVARGDRAVLGERGPQLGHVRQADLGPHVLVGVDDGDLAPLARDLDRQDLLGEIARRLRGGGPAVALRGQRVLVGPGHLKVGGDVLRRHAHVAPVERAGQRAD
jgi:hypothetical protein